MALFTFVNIDMLTSCQLGSHVNTSVKVQSRHYGDVIMGAIASQITSLTIVYSTVYWDADQRKHQSSASLAFVRGIHPAQMASNAEKVSIWWRHHVQTFSFTQQICGAAILGIGIWAYVDPTITSYVELTAGANFKAACILLIVVGAIIFLVGFLGCCGACKESTCMLSMVSE